MQCSKIKSTDKEWMARLRAIYFVSFPPEEQRPWESVIELEADEASEYEIIGILGDGGVLAGFITLWRFSEFCYIEHFAIAPELRSGGIGSKALREMVEKHCGGVPVVIEVEPSGSTPEAEGRIGFYCRNGFYAFPTYSYVQPPYGPGLPPVPLMLMATQLMDHHQLDRVAATLHTRVYGAE